MAGDLKWRDAFADVGGFGHHPVDGGWPHAMRIADIATLQRPLRRVERPISDKPSEMWSGWEAHRILQDAITAAVLEGELAVAVNESGVSLVDLARIENASRRAWECTKLLISPAALAPWLHAQGEDPNRHVLAWFSSQGVAWPPLQADKGASEEAMTWAALVTDFKSGKRRKNQHWTAPEKVAAQTEFNFREGWTRSRDGACDVKALKVLRAMAAELGITRSAITSHVGDEPPTTASDAVGSPWAGLSGKK